LSELDVIAFLQSLESSGLGTWVRESLYGFATLVGIHLMSIMLSAGMIVWFDLRLLGAVFPTVPVSAVYRRVIPFVTAGFVVMFTTGAMLFTGYATAAAKNPFFRVKVAALVLAGVNAAAYHLITERRLAEWDRAPVLPPAARAAGLVSMAAWATVILCGRLMAYTMY
jgi:hypothetical protein